MDEAKALNENRISDAFKILRPLAEEGNAEAAIMGYAIDRELFTLSPEERAEARDIIQLQHYWELAVWKKHAQGTLNLGLVYMNLPSSFKCRGRS